MGSACLTLAFFSLDFLTLRGAPTQKRPNVGCNIYASLGGVVASDARVGLVYALREAVLDMSTLATGGEVEG